MADPQTLTTGALLRGYRRGIFPMAEGRDNPILHWVEPHLRGILPLGGFHISRSLRRRILRGGYQVTVNRDFAATVAACADRPDTWINAELTRLYLALRAEGHAHSLEVWRGDKLIGGVFGLTLGRVFCGETMFSREVDGSKIALAYLVDRLRQAGFVLFDTQFLTPHLATLGGVEIPQAAYLALLKPALAGSAADFTAPTIPDPQLLMQRISQTS